MIATYKNKDLDPRNVGLKIQMDDPKLDVAGLTYEGQALVLEAPNDMFVKSERRKMYVNHNSWKIENV